MTLRTLNYGNYGIFLIIGNAGFWPSAVVASVIYPYFHEVLKFTWEFKVSQNFAEQSFDWSISKPGKYTSNHL